MPGFVKTPKDERRWAKAKEAAGKQTSEGSEGYWKLSNYIYHKMGKSQEDQRLAELYKADLLKFGGMMQLGEKPAKTSARMTAVKNTKKMPGAFDKPSKFFKSEEAVAQPKHPSVQKLRDFMMSTRAKR